jgi:hypothetical protein
MKQTTKSALLGAIKIACGILAFALFIWTPRSGRGILVFAVLFAVLIALAIVLSPPRDAGYWPNKPEDH